MQWKCDEKLAAEARRLFTENLKKALDHARPQRQELPEGTMKLLLVRPSLQRQSEFDAQTRPVEAWEVLLDAAGTLCCLGLESEVARQRSAARSLWSAIREWMETWDCRDLEEGVMELSWMEKPLRRLALADPGEERLAESVPLQERVVEILSRRDRLQLAMKACQALWDADVPLSEEAAEVVAVFDLKVREMGYLFLPFNERRRERLLWMAPEAQEDFWWWGRGIEYPREVLRSFLDVAQVLQEFPEAEDFLRELRDGIDASDALMRWAAHAPEDADLTLRGLLLAFPETPVHDAVSLAAASSGSRDVRAIFEDGDFGVYVDARRKRLHVFLKEIAEEDKALLEVLPTAYIRFFGQDLEMLPAHDRKGESAWFDLEDPAFLAPGATLFVQCGQRLRELKLDARLALPPKSDGR